ncbi:RNA polymerase sigma-70 factor (family 1) [Pedobacter africanus]|uniref:RNA polymerase sigma-70 factor (ECF subfamily) n=1 Tax=Pedobacter africanus TaxID=151894 RepID=A0ACC6KWW9_9SPHI|nr:RNA polymerase sigma-70 factor [Pedobacter africanus]MDR6783701.1 RNA polymerase sigma-70 factor (ECF subfamily) [Pedobacter africanus]
MSKAIRDLSDKLLIEKYRNGNASAFNVLFKRYYDSLYGYTLKNVKDVCVAEELVMDVMLGLWKRKGEILIEEDLKAYLYRSVKNAIYNHYRKKALQTISMDQVNESAQHLAKAADHELEVRELDSIYRLHLQQLSPQRRRVYELSREQHMTYAEIAKDMDISVNTVENYMVASLNFFRKQLKEHVDFTLIAFILFFLS